MYRQAKGPSEGRVSARKAAMQMETELSVSSQIIRNESDNEEEKNDPHGCQAILSTDMPNMSINEYKYVKCDRTRYQGVQFQRICLIELRTYERDGFIDQAYKISSSPKLWR